MNHRRATIFLCSVLALQALPSRVEAGTWHWEYKALSRSKKMIFTGWGMVIGAYLVGIAAGIPLLKTYGPCSPSHSYNENCGMGEALVIAATASPEFIARAVVGGLQLSSPRRLEEGDKVIAIFLLVDSMVQIAGLTLAIVGHVMYSKARKEIISQNMPPVGHSKNRLGIAAAPFVAAGGGGIALQGTF